MLLEKSDNIISVKAKRFLSIIASNLYPFMLFQLISCSHIEGYRKLFSFDRKISDTLSISIELVSCQCNEFSIVTSLFSFIFPSILTRNSKLNKHFRSRKQSNVRSKRNKRFTYSLWHFRSAPILELKFNLKMYL